jgi:fucose 4-O-acetylase-like acetyltransferase
VGGEAVEATRKRAYYVDWLRVLAVLALFPFHTGQIYNEEAAFYVKDTGSVPLIMGINSFIYLWHMPLFMFLSGIGSYYALRFRSGKAYLLERFRRLLIPLVFGTLVLIPPLTYIRMFGDPDKVWPIGFADNAIPGFDKSYFEYYPDFFNGIYPNGNADWGHLWFLAYLFTFSLIALPVFLYFKSEKGKWMIDWLKKVVMKPAGIFLFFIPIAAIEVLLRRAYPNVQNLISDWANFLMFITVFIFGFIMMSDEQFGEAVDRYWRTALTIGLLIVTGLSVIFAARIQTGLSENTYYFVEMTLRGIAIWLCMIGFLGFGRRYLNRGGRFIIYASEAALPVYILHLPVLGMIGFYVIQFDLPIVIEYIAILILSLMVSVLLYEILVKRFNIVRFFFGLKRTN